MMDLVFPILFMLIMVFAEALFLSRTKRQRIDWSDVVFNLNSGHIMLWLFRGLEIFCYGLVAAYFSLGLFDAWPIALVWLFAILVWDFGFYWLHRLHHRLGALWAVHLIHHQGENFNLSLAVRNSWYSSLTSIPFFMLLAVAGIPLYMFISVSILHYTIQFFNHNAVTPKLGWLEKLLVTPAHHRVHHVNDMEYANSNFGGSFIIWDKMFGSFRAGLPETPFTYGIGKNKPSQNPLVASNYPFMKLLGIPLKSQTAVAGFRCGSVMLVAGALALFLLVMGYVYSYGYGYDHPTLTQMSLFVLLAVGAIALGGISEGRQWGIMLWLAVGVLLPAIFIVGLGWRDVGWLICIPLVTLHSVAMAMGFGRRAMAEV